MNFHSNSENNAKKWSKLFGLLCLLILLVSIVDGAPTRAQLNAQKRQAETILRNARSQLNKATTELSTNHGNPNWTTDTRNQKAEAVRTLQRSVNSRKRDLEAIQKKIDDLDGDEGQSSNSNQ